MQAQTQWVETSDRQQLYVKTWGEKTAPALILLHGYPDNQEVWKRVIAVLVQDFYVVSYDVRGAGQSSIPKSIRAYSLAQLAADLMAVANAVLGQRAFHLAAHDWGSIQSWEAVTDPDLKGRILSYSTISGPCLDHAAFWMRKQFSENKIKFFKQMRKSWYIAAFQLPALAPTVWQFFQPEQWRQVVIRLERDQDIAINPNIRKDGRYGVNLYRANFIPRLLKPRQRYAICPVQAIVLKYDQFVGAELIDEMSHWVDDFQRVELAANHWAILSQPQAVATAIRDFALGHSNSHAAVI